MHRGGAVLILTVLLLIHMALPCLAAEDPMPVIPELKVSGSRFGSGGEEKVLRIREVGGPVPPVLCAMGMVLSAYLIGIGYEKWHIRKRK